MGALLITEQDQGNPCVGFLREQFSWLQVQTSDLLEDACTIISATNLVLARGSFSSSIASLNPNLRNLYIPFHMHTGIMLEKLAVCEQKVRYAQHLYGFPGYNVRWTSI